LVSYRVCDTGGGKIIVGNHARPVDKTGTCQLKHLQRAETANPKKY
jgi:hypothetical protein